MMHLARLAGLHHQADRRAQALPYEVMMRRRAGEQRGDRDVVGAGAAIGQHDDVDAFAHGAFGARAQRIERVLQAGRAGLGRPGGVERARLEMVVADLGDRADLLQIRVGEDRLAHLQALVGRSALDREQVRPRPDDGHQAHHQLFANRIDRRVGHLREILLEIGEQQLRLARQRRDRRIVAHRADRLLAQRRHRGHQDSEVFLGVAERLLAIEQREVGKRRRMRHRGQILEHDLVAIEPLLVGMAPRQRRLELLVGNEAALVEIDQQHLAGLQPPLGDDVLLRDRQHAHLGGHDDAVVAGDEIAGRTQPVAVERGADLPSIGERDGGGAVPGLHQGGVVLVEGAPFLVHQRIAGPGFRNEHHHGVGEPIAALHQELERVVEAGGIGLALVGDRPELADLLAVERRGDRGLPRRHPVEIAAQRIDLAVVRHHPVGMRQRPGRERIGGEALVHERERAFEFGIAQVRIIGAELVGQEHALVDDGAAGDRDRIIAGQAPLAALIDHIRHRLAQDIEAALEFGLVLDLLAAADEHLLMHRLGRLDRFAERRVVGRHVAPAQQRHAFALDHLGVDVADHLPPVAVARHEQGADRVFAGRRQAEAVLLGRRGEERVRDLDQDAGAVAGARIGADGAAMLEIAEDRKRVLDDLVGFAALDVGDESDPARALAQRRIIEPLHGRQFGLGPLAAGRRREGRRGICSAIPDHAHLEPRVLRPHPWPRSRGEEGGLRRTSRVPRRRSAPRPRGVSPLWSRVIGGLVARGPSARAWPLSIRRCSDARPPLTPRLQIPIQTRLPAPAPPLRRRTGADWVSNTVLT